MGTINYFTSDYITMGIKPYEVDDFLKDADFMAEMPKITKQFNVTPTEQAELLISEYYEDDLANIQYELNNHSFHYYHIVIKPGNYEGFTLGIENNYPVAYDDYMDRKEANKEITEIKQFLIDCAGLGLVACSPGWCTGYSDYKGTLKAIKEAIKEMRMEVKTIPTWRQYERG